MNHAPAFLRVPIRLCLAALLLAALALRLAPGLMPDRAADGSLTISLCSDAGIGPASVTVDLNAKKDALAAEDCPFAMMAHAALLPDAPLLIAAPFTSFLWAGAFFAPLNLAAALPLPPSTGPPALF